nr:GntR family transcriptional regulator [Tissierella sp.]
MIIKIEFDSEIPIYEQLKRQMIIGIANGEMKRGERLPSIRQLGEDLGINLHTVRKTYNILKDEGYVSMDRRNGAEIREVFDVGIEDFEKLINSDLEYLIANAKNRGMKEKDLLKLFSSYYESFKGGIGDE